MTREERISKRIKDFGAEKFTVTEDHLKLMAETYIEYRHDAYEGASGQDVKRPYGDTDVLGNIHEALTGEMWDEDEDGQMDSEMTERYLKLHREMANVIQICLANNGIEARTYQAPKYHTKDWIPV